MSDLRTLYQELIIDHGRQPRNFKVLSDATDIKEGFNPLCGDKLTVYLKLDDDKIVDASFKGEGCAISMASASMMTQALKGKKVEEADALFKSFHQVVMGDTNEDPVALLGKLAVLAGVSEYPARVKCATLAWHTAMAGLHHESGDVSTE